MIVRMESLGQYTAKDMMPLVISEKQGFKELKKKKKSRRS